MFHFTAPTDVSLPPPSTDSPTDSSLVTDTSITVGISIPKEANANGPIMRFRVIVRGASSSNDTITSYYVSSRVQPHENAPPYAALEQNISVTTSRRRQSVVGIPMMIR